MNRTNRERQTLDIRYKRKQRWGSTAITRVNPEPDPAKFKIIQNLIRVCDIMNKLCEK